MYETTETVATALAGVPVEDRRCLEAGAGVGNATAALCNRGAAAVHAVTDDPEHAAGVADRFAGDGRVSTLRADLRALPLADDAVGVLTAHALFNVVPTPDASPIVAELTRVAEPGAWMVVDDYSPILDDDVRALFGVANAVGELDDARPTFTYYPSDHLRALFEAKGWAHEHERTLLDPVPWSADLLDTHLDLLVERAERAGHLPNALAGALRERATSVRAAVGETGETGEMYSLAFRLPE
jgi:SAM-dependent methyltransferase